MLIPWQSLSKSALIGVVQEFVLREGTEYGAEDIPLDVKVEQVIVQLEAEEIGIFYDSELGTTTIQLMETWENPEKKNNYNYNELGEIILFTSVSALSLLEKYKFVITVSNRV